MLEGDYIDLFDPNLGYTAARRLKPGERTLLYDLSWARKNGPKAKVAACGARVRNEQLDGDVFQFVTRGPSGTTARARVILPGAPAKLRATPEVPIEQTWEAESGTLLLSFPNQAEDISIALSF